MADADQQIQAAPVDDVDDIFPDDFAGEEDEILSGDEDEDVGAEAAGNNPNAGRVVLQARRGGFMQRQRPIRIRPKYTEAQKRRAVELLDMGLSCRTVAATLGPHCSSGTPIRWRKKFRAAEAARLGLAQVIRGAGGNPEPLPNQIEIPEVAVNRPVAPPRRQGPNARRPQRPRRRAGQRVRHL